MNNINVKTLFGTVCKIESQRGEKIGFGHGVLVMPDVVLTSWHVLQGGADLSFTNERGDVAEMVKGSHYNKYDASLDIATVEISRPLSSKVATFTSDNKAFVDTGGHLIHRFNGFSESYDAKFDSKSVQQHWNGMEKNTFVHDKKIQRGYSGSPIFNKKGELTSVLCFAVCQDERDMHKPSFSSAGPSHKALTQFLRKSLF